jgi:acyl-coenzyme A synthetase/AMP-(fatty) acid ligase
VQTLRSSSREVAEAAVVGVPHDIKRQGVYAYLVAQGGASTGAVLK